MMLPSAFFVNILNLTKIRITLFPFYWPADPLSSSRRNHLEPYLLTVKAAGCCVAAGEKARGIFVIKFLVKKSDFVS
jgi:hypothetical protein